MTSFEIVGAFATIVGLLADYKQEAQSKTDQENRDFFEWLEYHRHQELKNLICANSALSAEVSQLLRADTRSVLLKLQALDRTLASVASQFEEFKGLASAAVRPEDQNPEAVDLLRKLVRSGGTKFVVRYDRAREYLAAYEGSTVRIDHQSKFFDDDLATLVEWGFLREDSATDCVRTYLLTRAAERLVNAAPPKPVA